MEVENLKQPYSLEAEQSVLGSIIIDPSSINEVMSMIQPQYFFLPLHRTVFSCLTAMFETAKSIDAVTLLEEMKKSQNFDEATGKQYILQLAEAVPTSRHIKSYAKIIRDKCYLRALIEASSLESTLILLSIFSLISVYCAFIYILLYSILLTIIPIFSPFTALIIFSG